MLYIRIYLHMCTEMTVHERMGSRTVCRRRLNRVELIMWTIVAIRLITVARFIAEYYHSWNNPLMPRFDRPAQETVNYWFLRLLLERQTVCMQSVSQPRWQATHHSSLFTPIHLLMIIIRHFSPPLLNRNSISLCSVISSNLPRNYSVDRIFLI